ncbi:hypothetical protein NicSoilB4_31540 [Arthrobacter sp. NicSoilB4]|nr:hypothetical protein NicSoilB4_31540 [Arthrobacter sp. NicSoilB4]
MAGAILAELDLLGAIGLDGKHVKATGAAPQTDFQHELELIRGKSRPHTPKQWVSMLEGRAQVQRVYEGMASRGIVEHVGEKHLGVFKSMRYPEKDHSPEAALLNRIQAALGGAPAEPAKPGAAPDASAPGAATEATAPDIEPGTPLASTASDAAPGTAPGTTPASPETATAPGTKPDAKETDARTMALIALLHSAGLFGKLFPAADRGRASELAKDYWPSRAVEDELLLVRLAEEEAATL